MKILHIASFKGNVGDIINHNGFYNITNNIFNNPTYEKVELRNFYRSAKPRLEFNRDFASKLDKYDMLIIGGGGFFDVRWDYSNTATTLDFTNEFIENVNIPVLVNAMGYHGYPGATTEKHCRCFSDFMNKITNMPNWHVTLRNDGSLERIQTRFKDERFVSRLVKVADNGFFAETKPLFDLKCKEKKYLR